VFNTGGHLHHKWDWMKRKCYMFSFYSCNMFMTRDACTLSAAVVSALWLCSKRAYTGNARWCVFRTRVKLDAVLTEHVYIVSVCTM
jgi:hypothetical protein